MELKALTSHYETIREAAHSTPINHIDEATWRRFGPAGTALLWLWGMASRRVAYFKITAKRSKNAFVALIGDWRGVLQMGMVSIKNGTAPPGKPALPT